MNLKEYVKYGPKLKCGICRAKDEDTHGYGPSTIPYFKSTCKEHKMYMPTAPAGFPKNKWDEMVVELRKGYSGGLDWLTPSVVK